MFVFRKRAREEVGNRQGSDDGQRQGFGGGQQYQQNPRVSPLRYPISDLVVADVISLLLKLNLAASDHCVWSACGLADPWKRQQTQCLRPRAIAHESDSCRRGTGADRAR
jgi:hypothetical protein